MKILIVGVGAIGASYGYVLAKAGIEVTHFVRPGTQARFKAGIALEMRDGRKGHQKEYRAKYVLTCTEAISPEDNYDLIIVSVTPSEVEPALQQLVPVAKNTRFLIFGANWDGIEVIERYLPPERYAMGFPFGGATQQNGVYWSYVGNRIFLGTPDSRGMETFTQIKSLFARAEITSVKPKNILHHLWTTHAGAVGISAGLAKTRDVDAFLRDKSALAQSYDITREILGLCRLRGADPNENTDLMLFRVPVWLFSTVFRLFCNYDPGVKRVLRHVTPPATDINELRQAMLKTAEELNYDMPLTKASETGQQPA
jgi:2-dehydropantoate 2-reductase